MFVHVPLCVFLCMCRVVTCVLFHALDGGVLAVLSAALSRHTCHWRLLYSRSAYPETQCAYTMRNSIYVRQGSSSTGAVASFLVCHCLWLFTPNPLFLLLCVSHTRRQQHAHAFPSRHPNPAEPNTGGNVCIARGPRWLTTSHQ